MNKDLKKELKTIAKSIISEEIDPIEGCREINSIYNTEDFFDDEKYREYFSDFELIDSDTEIFPKGRLRNKYNKKYLEELDKKELNYMKGALKIILEACSNLIKFLDNFNKK